MNSNKGYFYKLIALLIFFNCNLSSQVLQDSLLFIKPGKFITNWELFSEDNPSIIDTAFPSSKKIVKSIYFKTDSSKTGDFRKIIWFRKNIMIDSSQRDKSFSLNVEIIGAAEIYINQKLVKKFGVVSTKDEEEIVVAGTSQIISYPFVPNKEYLIAIKFSNHRSEHSYSKGGDRILGLKIKLEETNNLFATFFMQTVVVFSFGLVTFAFFFSLAFVHFIIFLFYKEEKANAYYAFFCFTVSALVFSLVFKTISLNDGTDRVLNYIIALSPAIIFANLSFMIRSFFKLKFPKWYFLFILFFVFVFIQLQFEFPFLEISYVLLVVCAVVETIRAIFIAFREKIKGVKIIGLGTSFFLVFVIAILYFMIFHIGGANNNYTMGFLFLSIILLCIFSIPISITIFLSYQISLTNRSLSQKLNEVEELSKQTIEQEKEKQKILLNQKSLLEEQVLERTLEITDQKKIIEEKNKDIIDSINYAKRIQTAILPEMNYFKSVFNNSFVIYHPRDIVSGDFYYVTEINNLKFLFIADCTGHGVPGALMSMVGSNLIHKIIHENEIFEPKEILQTLHIELRQALKQDQNDSQNRDGMDAAIVVVKDGNLYYAGANRSLLYFNKLNELCEIKPTKTPIGGSHILSVDISQSKLNVSDIKEFYLFSDGFADQFGGLSETNMNSLGKKLMISRFKNWLVETLNLKMDEKERFLNNEFQKWKGNLEQVDDVCVICVRF
ncbi:MAG: SpoIIE family protein phosphatase [Bacteroidota bacterium]|nr:SpoIIE family protein phosphatase [Bacteroidota bacterium]MDP3145536.1 SpoIIE family protein phosphatase [Bacteroidota bacterium]